MLGLRAISTQYVPVPGQQRPERPAPAAPARPLGTPAPRPDGPVLRIPPVQANGRAILALAGDIDITTADTVSTAARDCLREHPASLSLDLRSLTFCDCAGVWALRSAHRQAGAVRAQFRLIAPAAHVLRIFSLTGADDLLSAAQDPP